MAPPGSKPEHCAPASLEIPHLVVLPCRREAVHRQVGCHEARAHEVVHRLHVAVADNTRGHVPCEAAAPSCVLAALGASHACICGLHAIYQ
eukprot:265180-Chlamydomonas_euryale.AAC.2